MNDYKDLKILIESNISIRQAIEILKVDHVVFQEIDGLLRQGKSIEQVLLQFRKHENQASFELFLKFMNLEKSLLLATKLNEEKRKLQQEVKQKLTYPMMLLLSTFLGSTVFLKLCLPKLLEVMSWFDIEQKGFQPLLNVFYCFYGVEIFLVVFVLFLLVGLKIHRFRRLMYRLLYQFYPTNPFVKMVSKQFMTFYLACLQQQISSKQTILVLKELKHRWVSKLAEMIDVNLLNGETIQTAFQQSLLDPVLINLFVIGQYSDQFETLIQGYLLTCQNQFEKSLRMLLKLMKAFSYTMLSFMMILVYQILLIPLQIIQTFG